MNSHTSTELLERLTKAAGRGGPNAVGVGTAPRLLLRPTEAAAALGMSRSAFYVLLARREIPSIALGRSRRIPLAALEAWIADQLRLVAP